MIDEIFGNLKTELSGKLNNETDVPSDKMDGIMSVLGDAVKGTAAKEMMGGNLSGVMSLFSDNPNDEQANQIESKMSSNIVSDLMDKVGISSAQAQNIAAIALPFLIKMITGKKNESSKDDSSFLTDLLGGGDKGGVGGIAKDLLGGFLK